MSLDLNMPLLRWNQIEVLANNDLARIVGAVPLFGYLILFNDQLVEAVSFDTIAGVSNAYSSPFFLSGISKLHFAFFGSIFLFSANLVFRWKSPEALKSSKNDLEFADRVISSYSLREIEDLENKVFDETWQIQTNNIEASTVHKIREKGYKRPLFGISHKGMLTPDHKEAVRNISREWWVGEMCSTAWARITTLALSIVGYAMLALPTLDITQAVLRSFF